MDKLVSFLDLQKQATQAGDLKAFEFIALNKTRDVVDYKQAIFWSHGDFGVSLHNISGNAALEPNGPYASWLKGFIRDYGVEEVTQQKRSALLFSHDTIAPENAEGWEQHNAAHTALLALQTPEDGIMGGLWLERDQAFTEAEQATLEELSISYAQSYALLKLRQRSSLTSPWKKLRKHQKLLLIFFLLLCFFPVRLSITAPAEIVAQSPSIVTVPFDGILERIDVSPGDTIIEGMRVFTMDTTDIENQIASSSTALQAAQRNLSRLRKEVLRTPEKKPELHALLATITEKKIELGFAQKRLKASGVSALTDGIAIFADRQQFEGQPVRTGQKIMTIANPDQSELLIKIPVNSMVPLSTDLSTSFFLNVAPLHGYQAEITSIGYQASPDADGILSYKIRAKILSAQGDETPRIGWKGTAKIEGEWSILSYAILRRPLITLRHLTGF